MPPKKERLFNQRKRRIFRNRIPSTEAGFGIFFLLFTAAMGWWFIAQKDNFDPSERDISMDVLVADAVEDNLYKAPLKRWSERGALAGAASAAPDTGIFPQSILEGGWEASSRFQEFTEDNLYEKINGAAPQYFQYGFQKLHFISVKKTGADEEINIEFYDMGAFPNALGIFAAQRSEGSEIVQQDQAWYYNTGAGALGITDKYYFKITGNASSDVITEKSKQIVSALASVPEGGGDAVAKTFQALTEKLGVPFAGISFQKNDAFQYAFATDFWFAQPEGGDLRYFVHFAESEEAAMEMYQKLYDENATSQFGEYELVEESDSFAVMKHKFLDTFFTLNRKGATIFGIENAPDQAGALQSQSQFAEAMFNE